MKRRRLIIQYIEEFVKIDMPLPFLTGIKVMSGINYFYLLGSFLFFYIDTLGQCDRVKITPINTFNQCANGEWVLVFKDDFKGNSLDKSVWRDNTLHIRIGNGEQQYYTYNQDNIEVSNGILKIIAKRETIYAKAIDYEPGNKILSDGLPNKRYFYYTSANIETHKKFPYGKFEARVKIPKGRGFWPAFWTRTGTPVYNEIDIFEFYNKWLVVMGIPIKILDDLSPKTHRTAIHYFPNSSKHYSCSDNYLSSIDFSEEFHIFSLTWENDKVEWYVDGNLVRQDLKYYTLLGQEPGCTIYKGYIYLKQLAYPYDPMNILLNFAIQDGDNSPISSTKFPAEFQIDWVKYYKKVECDKVSSIHIVDSTLFPIYQDVYNTIIGKHVTIDCNYTVNDNYHLNVTAQNRIILKPGFRALKGSVFRAKIAPLMCSPLKIQANGNVYNKEDTVLSINAYKTNQANKITFFPNPTTGIITIEADKDNFQQFSIEITTLQGYKVRKIETLSNRKIEIDISDYKAGVYILHIRDDIKRQEKIFKIVKL